MIRATLLLLCYFLNWASISAQNEVNVSKQEIEIGTNLLDSSALKGIKYIFPNRVPHFKVDPINNCITLQLRDLNNSTQKLKNKGIVVRYDTKAEKVLWTKKINFQFEDIQQFDDLCFLTTDRESYRLDNETGKELWEVKSSLTYLNTDHELAFGFRLQATSPSIRNRLEGINLINGERTWKREFKTEYGWDNIIELNDSIVLIKASGLHSLNIFNGSGWDYQAITGDKEMATTSLYAGFGLMGAFFFGVGVYIYPGLISTLSSNTLIDSGFIYFSSKEELVKLTNLGELVWHKELPTKHTSTSKLHLHENTILMINNGSANNSNRQVNFGNPFIATFNPLTGDQNYLSELSETRRELIKDYKLDENKGEIQIVFNNRIAKYDVSNGEMIATQQLNVGPQDELNLFVGDNIFIQEDSTYMCLTKLNTNSIYVFTQKGKILQLDKDYQVQNKYKQDEIYTNYLIKNNLKFISKGSQTFIINKNGKVIADIPFSNKATYLDKKLYTQQENTIIEIDLKPIYNILLEDN